jgi:hypothetical protein
MSAPDDETKAGDLSVAGDQIGYGRPPAATRFQPGRSGNPRGRPRRLKPDYRAEPALAWLGEVVSDEVYREVEVRENGRKIKMTALQTMLRASAVAGAKGNRLHTKMLLDYAAQVERLAEERRQANLVQALAYKAEWQKACSLAARRGTTPTPPHLPHPDDVLIDFVTGTVTINGPSTPEQQQDVDTLISQREELLDVLRQIDGKLADADDEPTLIAEREALAVRIAEIEARVPQRLRRKPTAPACSAGYPAD